MLSHVFFFIHYHSFLSPFKNIDIHLMKSFSISDNRGNNEYLSIYISINLSIMLE